MDQIATLILLAQPVGLGMLILMVGLGWTVWAQYENSRRHTITGLSLAVVGFCILAASWASLACAAEVPHDALRYQRDLTRTARAEWGLDAPVATFAAQIHQESKWRTDAKSKVGAEGLAQFMPATATWISGAYKWGEPQPYSPAWALRALVTYDRWLWDRVKAADDCQRMGMTLSAYNGGLGWVYRDQKMAAAAGADPRRWFDQVERFNAGRSAGNFRENRGYPRTILIKWQPLYESWGGGIACA